MDQFNKKIILKLCIFLWNKHLQNIHLLTFNIVKNIIKNIFNNMLDRGRFNNLSRKYINVMLSVVCIMYKNTQLTLQYAVLLYM